MQKRLHSSGYLGSLFSRLLFLITMVTIGQSAWADATTIFDAAASGWTATGVNLTTGTTKVGDVTWNGGGSAAIGTNTLKFSDEVEWTKYISFGGGSTFSSSKTLARVFTYTPSVAGTIKVYTKGGGSSARALYVSQSITSTDKDTSTGLANLDGASQAYGICTATVEANKMVYIWGTGSMLVYGITFEQTGEKTQWDKPKFTLGAWDADNQKYTITIASETGTTMKYTVGSEAEATSTTNSVDVTAAPGTVIKATATGSGYNDSAEETYTVPAAPAVATPTFTFAGYSYANSGYPVTIACTTDGATLTYNINDGTDADVPSGNIVYVPGEGKLTVKANKTGWSESTANVTVNKAPSKVSPETLIPVILNDNYVKNIAQAYKSVNFIGTCVGGVSSTSNKANELKLRTNQQGDGSTANTFQLKVNEGYTVTKVDVKAYSNNTQSAANVQMTGVSVDGTALSNFTTVEFPVIAASGATQEYATASTGDISATNNITFTFDNSKVASAGASNNQIVAEITVYYSGQKYTVTCNTAEHGTVTTNAAAAGVEEGTEVTITATPNGGYKLNTVTVKDASNNAVTVTNNKFTMPASNVTVTAAFVESSVSSYDTGAPFGFATCNSRTETGYNLIGGGAINPTGAAALSSDKVITLTPSLTDAAMDTDIKNAINSHDVIIFDGSNGKSFILENYVEMKNLKNKTLLGINGAKLATKWYSTADDIAALEAKGVSSMSTSGGGGTLSNGTEVKEEAEYNTRQIMIDRYDYANRTTSTEWWRKSGIFYVKGCENIIFRNLTFQGPGSMDLGGADLVSIIDSSNHIWVDHCDFMDGQDGNMDITNESDFVTVSWSKFHYTTRSYMHQNTNLCGSSDDKTTDDDKLSVTWAYNHWGEGCLQRMPMARFGRFHLLNNYYTSTNCKLCVNALKNSEFLIEGNKFADDLTKVYKAENATQVIWRSTNATGSNLDSNYPLPTTDDNTAASTLIPYTYSTSLAAANVPAEVGGHVGPVNTYPTSSFTVTASATNGTVAIKNGETAVESGATVEYGTALTFTATPAEGYTFSKWNDGNTDNPRTVTVSGDLSLTAVFIDGSTPFVDKAATISWAIGNESNSTLSDGISNGISTTGVKVGSDLTTTTASYSVGSITSGTLVNYAPTTSKAGNVAADMIEYTVQVKKGVTFKPTSISYDAVKVGTDGASFSWSYTVDGVESDITTVAATDILRNSYKTAPATYPALNHTANITSDGGQKVTIRFYISGVDNGKSMSIGNVKINGTINGTVAQRAFKDFKVDLRSDPYTVSLPTTGTLPTDVQVTGSWHDGQHGYQNGTVVVPVDGPVKFTVGGCTYGSDITVKNAAGTVIATLATKAAGCDSNSSTDKNVVWTYNSETAETLTFTYSYLPYFFAEACDLIPMRTVTYYDVDGKTKLAEKEIEGGSALVYDTEAEGKVTVADGYKFRGWFNSTAATAIKVAAGTAVEDNLSLYAKATKIENPQVGDIYTYPFGSSSFYYQDHEGITEFTGSYNGAQHGYGFIADQKISVKVAGKAVITFGICKYAATDATFTVTDANGNQVGDAISAYNETDGSVASVKYEGEATTLTFTASGKSYMHNMTIYNVASIPTKNEQGYYVIKSGDAASLKLAAASLQDGDKIYLPNGTYDLGSDLTSGAPGITISANNVSLIGESMENTIVKGYGIVESINTATVKTTGDNFYAQDITLQCYADYGTGSDTKTAERALGLWNCSKHSTLKNVYLQGTQDTYYTNYGSAGQLGYVEGGRIDGTVDYICGAGNHYFNGVKLYVVNSAHRTSKDVIVAPNMTADDAYGYVFKDAVIDGAASQKGTYFLARPWNNSPACTWIDTKINLATAAAGYTNMTAGKVLRFHEYNTQDADGNVITSHNLDACGGAEGSDALYLTEEQTATYTVANVLGDWATTAQSEAAQVTTMPTEGVFLLADGTMTTTVPTEGIVRVANTRGGFGPEIALTVPEEGSVQIIANVKEDNVATPEGTTPEEKAAAVTAVKGVTEANTAVTDVKTGMANAVNTDAIQFEGVTIPEGTQIILSMDIVYDNASVSKENDEAVVKSMTFEVKPIATAKVENTAYSTTVSNSAIKGYITFRLPVAMNANYKFANVKHEGEDFGQKAVLTHETTGEKYIELVVSSFSKYSYELTNDEIAPDEVALSEEDEAYPENGVWDVNKAYNITLSRTMSKDKWNTLMLPFPMTAEEVKTSFGAEAKVMKMTGIENYVVKFETATAIDACEPYIVQPAADVATISVTHKTGLKSTITDNDHKMELEATATCGGATKFGTWTAASCFANSTISKEKSCYILSGNKFYLVNNDVSVKGYRWAFGETGATSAKGSLDMSFDGVVTGISEINANANITANGKYMKDGRIVIIKDGKQFNAAGQEVK